MKFSEYRQMSEATKDLISAIGSTKTNTLLKKKVIPAIQAHHDKVFGVGNHHLEFPLENDIPEHVKKHVEENGDSLSENGVKLKSGREVPVAKYLAKSNAPKNVQDEHQNWEKHKVANSKLVITRHSGEVASASTGTHWSSCANPKNDHTPAWDSMPAEIKHGTLMAMHIHKDAKVNEHGEYNSKDVLGRTLIKHHEPDDINSTPDNKKEITFHRENRTYGAFPESANKVVDEFTKKHYPQTNLLSVKHKDLYDDDSSSIKPNMGHKDIEHAFTGGHEKELVGHAQSSIVDHPDADEKIFALAINSVHAAPSKNAATRTKSPETLDKAFSKNTDEKNPIRHRIVASTAARNPHASEELISKGLKCKDSNVRMAAASNKNATTSHIDTALKDKDVDVRYEAANNKNATTSHIDTGLSDKDHYVRQASADNPNATPENLHKALMDSHIDVRATVISHKNINASHIDAALDDNNMRLKIQAAGHKKATPEHLHKALNDFYTPVRVAAASNKNATKDVLEKASKDDKPEVQKIATDRLSNGDHK